MSTSRRHSVRLQSIDSEAEAAVPTNAAPRKGRSTPKEAKKVVKTSAKADKKQGKQPVATKPKRGGKEAVKPKSKPSEAKPSKAKKQAKVPAEDEMEEGYDEETHSPDGRTWQEMMQEDIGEDEDMGHVEDDAEGDAEDLAEDEDPEGLDDDEELDEDEGDLGEDDGGLVDETEFVEDDEGPARHRKDSSDESVPGSDSGSGSESDDSAVAKAKMRSLKTRVNELQAIVESIKKSGGLNSAQPRVVLVGGPPASGKSVLAKEIGRQMGVQVVTGDGDIMKNAKTLLEKSPYAGQVQLFPASATRKTVRTLFTRRRTHIQGFSSADCEPMVQLKDKKNKPAGEMLNIPLCDLQTIRTFIERQVQDLGQSKLPENLEAAVVGRHFLDQLTRIMGVSSSKQGQPIGMHGLNTEATKALICAKLDPLAGPNGLPKDLFEGWQLVYVKALLSHIEALQTNVLTLTSDQAALRHELATVSFKLNQLITQQSGGPGGGVQPMHAATVLKKANKSRTGHALAKKVFFKCANCRELGKLVDGMTEDHETKSCLALNTKDHPQCVLKCNRCSDPITGMVVRHAARWCPKGMNGAAANTGLE